MTFLLRKERPRPPRLEEQKPMDRPRSLGSSRTASADRTSPHPSQSSPTPAAASVRRDSGSLYIIVYQFIK